MTADGSKREVGRQQVVSYHFDVLSHSASTNAVGRALAMAMVAEELGPTTVWAVDDGPLWKGAAQFGRVVNLLRSKAKTSWGSTPGHQRVVWVSKGIHPLNNFLSSLLTQDPDAIVILDLDDDDAALAAMFISQTWKNRVRLNPMRRMHPARIRNAQEQIANRSDAFTFSTNALSARFSELYRPMLRVPHVRPASRAFAGNCRIVDSTVVHVGTFGTLRSHKGLTLLRDILIETTEIKLHVFEGSGLAELGVPASKYIEHAVNEDLSSLYAKIDVALIPMSSENGADVQLPAKLIDAMRSGIPIVTSPTSAIREIAGSTVAYMNPDASTDETVRLIFATARRDGTASRTRYEHVAAPQPVATSLRDLLQSLTSSLRTGA